MGAVRTSKAPRALGKGRALGSAATKKPKGARKAAAAPLGSGGAAAGAGGGAARKRKRSNTAGNSAGGGTNVISAPLAGMTGIDSFLVPAAGSHTNGSEPDRLTAIETPLVPVPRSQDSAVAIAAIAADLKNFQDEDQTWLNHMDPSYLMPDSELHTGLASDLEYGF